MARSSPCRVADGCEPWPLHDTGTTRAIEAQALAATPAHALMARAGAAAARLAAALVPDARCMGILAGPGNNGGDGLIAAAHLRRSGRRVRVLHLAADPGRTPPDAADAWRQARLADLEWTAEPSGLEDCDLLVDAMLGLGAARAPAGAIGEAVTWTRRVGRPLLALDLPTGLHADTGRTLGDLAVQARWTLSLLTLKPGLFTGLGRDHAGQVWFDDLGVADPAAPNAWLGPWGTAPSGGTWVRHHAQHKGSFGNVIVVGGARGMGGAARLAATAALSAGAGRVYVCPLDASLQPDAPGLAPELMVRPLPWAEQPETLSSSTVVCGCGGGPEVADRLPALLQAAARLVLDADALNALAASPALQEQLRTRSRADLATVLTPHPLEAGRLLGASASQVQSDRLAAARELARSTGAVVVLKGSGSVLATPGRAACWINASGNARLATPGSGDVLAGWIGGAWSAGQRSGTEDGATLDPGQAAWQAVRDSTWLHGHAADVAAGAPGLPLRARDLIDLMAQAAPRR